MLSSSLLREKKLGGRRRGARYWQVLLFGFFAESKSEGFGILQEKSEARFALWTVLDRGPAYPVSCGFAVLRVWKSGRK